MSQKDIVKTPNPALLPGFFLLVWFGVGFFLVVLLPALKVSLFPTGWCWDGHLPTFFFASPWPDFSLLESTPPELCALRGIGLQASLVSEFCNPSPEISSQPFERHQWLQLLLQSRSIFSSALLQELFLIQVPNSAPSFPCFISSNLSV